MIRKINYVKNSKVRIFVLKSLEEYPKIPSEIAREKEEYTKRISTTLKELKEQDLVECINPEVRKGRIYRLTETGKQVVDEL